MFGNLLEGNTSERNFWSTKSFWDLECAMRCSINEDKAPGIPLECRIFPLNTAVHYVLIKRAACSSYQMLLKVFVFTCKLL